MLELLRLLAQDAPVDRIEEAAAKLVASDPVDGPAARALALAIRAGIDARRRREAELSALVDTARDLASRSDPGGVLDAIVRRARTLLATDVAYLTLADPERGDTYMRATAGSVSAVTPSRVPSASRRSLVVRSQARACSSSSRTSPPSGGSVARTVARSSALPLRSEASVRSR